jgi:hypothetical protein
MAEATGSSGDATASSGLPTAAPRALGTRAVLALCLLVESAIFASAALGRLPTPPLLGAHLLTVALAALLLIRPLRSGRDGGLALIGLITILATGPFGALGALLLPHLGAPTNLAASKLEAWYARIALSAEQDAFTRTSDRIAIGRAANLAAARPEALASLFTGSAIDAQQTALGMIARTFHPQYLPALKLALDSPEPIIRVQAAAVAARVRDKLRDQAAAMLARAADPTLPPGPAVLLAGDLEAMVASGLLEEGTRVAALRAVDGLRARTMARLDAAHRAAGVPTGAALAPAPHAHVAAEAYLAFLLAEGRFAEFRAARSRLRLPTTGRYRHRRVNVGHAAPTGRRVAWVPVRRTPRTMVKIARGAVP